ncbi:MAG: hypothetical protein M0Q92_12640 [Methanoregula sp.]|jgi:hypothetical protein|nr:hypothetical protein [Methanoregula sp.]
MHFRNISTLVPGLALIGILLACLPGPALAAVSPGSWQVSTVAEDIRYYPFASVAYGPDSVPHVAYRSNVTRSIHHAWESGGTWNTETVGPSAGTFTTSVAISPYGIPSVSYGDGLYFGNMMFAGKNGSSWERTVVARGSMADAGQFSSLAFDRQGIPYITYNDGQVLASLYYAGLNTTTGEWEFSLIDDDTPYTGDAGYSSSLKIDAAGHPHVAYISDDPWGLRYATSLDGTNWTVTKLDELDRPNYFYRTYSGVSMALDSRGYPHINYYNQTTTDTIPSQIYYLSWSGTAWDRETVEVLSKRDFTTSLAIDSRDVPHIAYCDVGAKALKYATRTPSGVWSEQIVEQGGNTLRMPSLALDSTGRAGIAYYDMTAHALKFAQWTG